MTTAASGERRQNELAAAASPEDNSRYVQRVAAKDIAPTTTEAQMQQMLKKIADSRSFQNFVTLVIVFAGALVGAETYESFATANATLFHILDQIIVWIFVAEAAIKIGAEGKQPWRYFKDSWNIFDFVIVVACFLPVNSQYVLVLRLARLLRVLKLVRALPRLQLIVGALLKSIPSMGYVSLLLLLLFYVYACAGVFMFGNNDPIHFGSLSKAMITLFCTVTTEGWIDTMDIQRFGCDQVGYPGSSFEALCTEPEKSPIGGLVFFVSFVLLGTMVVLNLFIGVIMNGMESAQQEREDLDQAERQRITGVAEPTLSEHLKSLHRQLDVLQSQLNVAANRAEISEKKAAKG